MSGALTNDLLGRLDSYLEGGLSTGLYRGEVVRNGWWHWSGQVVRIEDGSVVWADTYRTKAGAKRRTGQATRDLNALIP